MPNNTPINNFAPVSGNIAGIPSSNVNWIAPTFDMPSTKDFNENIETPKTLSDVLNQISSQLPNSGILSPIYTPQEQAKRYANSGFFNPLLDNEEIAASNQSAWTKWGHGFAKMGGLALGTFAEGLLQIPDLLTGVQSGNIWKGPLYEAIDNSMNNLEDKFPNYYSNWEKEHPIQSGFNPFGGGMANFWSDKVVKNLGFTIGAIGAAAVTDVAVGAATGAIGEIPLLGQQIGKLSLALNKIFTGTNRVDELLSTAKYLNKSDDFLKNIKNLAGSVQFQNDLNAARYVTTLAMSANTEAGFEARQGYKELKEQLIAELGHEPSAVELEKIEQYATAAGNTRYGLNMALLMTSNAIQFEHLLKPYNSYKRSLKEGISATTAEQSGKIGLGKKIESAADIDNLVRVDKPTNLASRMFNKVKPAIPDIFAEGVLEEGGQFAVEKGVNQYFKDKYDGKIKGTLTDVLNSVGTGLAAQYGSTEGYENMILGALTTGITHPITSFVENKQRTSAGVLSPEDATNKALQNLNTQGVTGIFGLNYDSTAQAIKINKDIQKAVQDNNIFAFKNLKRDEFYNFVVSGIQNNRFDVRKAQLEMLKELPEEELNKLFNIKEGDRESSLAYVDKLIAQADTINKAYDSVAKTFVNPFTFKGNAQTKEQNEETKAWYAFEDYKAALVKMSYNVTDFNQRTQSIQEQLASIHPGLNTNLVSKLADPASLLNLKNEYKKEAYDIEKSLNTLIKRSENPEMYDQAKEKAKKLATLATMIEDFLNTRDSNKLPDVFAKVLNFEVNAQNSKTADTIDPVKINDIINYGNDINNIERGKQWAADTYQYLLTADGYEDFIKNHEEWASSLFLKDEKPTDIEDTLDINGKSYDLTRPYKTNIKERFTVPTGTTDLKNPKGEIVDTFKTKEEAEAARDAENKNIEDNLEQVTIKGYENGRVVVEDNKGNIQYINPIYLANFEKTLSEAEIVNQNKDKYKKFDEQIANQTYDIPDYMSGLPTLEEVLESIGKRESPKKAKEIVNQSTTFNVKSVNSYYPLQKHFFSQFDKFPKEVKDNARLIFVHINNQKALGLDGLVQKTLEQGYEQEYPINEFDKDGKPNPKFYEKTPILAVFVKQEGGAFKFLNSKGEVIEPSLEDVVLATMPVPKYSNTNGEGSPWRNDTSKEYIDQDNKNWLNARKQILSNTTSTPEMYTFSISAGVPETNIENDKPVLYPVSDVLINKTDLNTSNMLQIATGTAIYGNVIEKGKLVLVNGNTVEVLHNRYFTENEVNNIYDVLMHLAKTSTIENPNKEILTYLRGILFWNKPKDENSKIFKGQIFLKEGFLAIGPEEENRFPFTTEGLHQNEKTIKEKLSGLYINANNKLVQNNEPFRELYIDKNGDLKARTWNSYQHYLISDTIDIEEDDNEDYGKKRNVKDIPFTTSVRPINPNIPNDSNYTRKYAIVLNSVSENAPLYTTVLETKKPETKTPQTPPPPSKKDSDLKVSNTYDNKLSIEGFDFSFAIKKTKDGVVNVDIKKDKSYFKAVKELLEKPTEHLENIILNVWNEEFITDEFVEQFIQGAVEDFIFDNTKKEDTEAPFTVETETKIKQDAPTPPPTTKKPNLDDFDFGGLDSNFRIAQDTYDYTQHHLEQSEEWFKKNLPGVELKRIQHLIPVTGGGYAWGSFQNNVVRFYENAKKGTIEHEAFEAVWFLYATLKERKNMIDEFHKRSGSFISHETGKSIKYSEATEHEVKEQLAEELGDYVLDNKLFEEPKQDRNKIYQFFKSFINFIKNLLGLKPNAIKNMFDKINSGYYQNMPYLRPGPGYASYRIEGLTESDSYNMIRGITFQIMTELFKDNRSLIEFDEAGSRNVSDIYKKVFTALDELFTMNVPTWYMKNMISEPLYTKYQQLWEIIKTNNSVVNQEVEDYLKTFNIVVDLSRESFNDDDLVENTSKEEENTEYAGRNNDSYVENQFKVDSIKKASASIKLLIGTLAERTYIDPNDKTKGTKPKRDVNTLMPQMVNYNKTFSFLLNKLWDLNTWDEKAAKIVELAKDYPNYEPLIHRLKIGQPNVDFNTWRLRVKFFNVMSKQKPNAYVEFIGKDESGKAGSRIRAVNANGLAKDISQSWVDFLKLALGSPNNTVVLNDEEDYVFDASKLKKDFLKDVKDQLEFLKSLHIDFTNQMYNKLSAENKNIFSSTVQNLQKELLSVKKDVVELTPSSLNNAGNFIKLAELYLSLNEESSYTFYSIESEKQAQFVGNNFISQTLNDINNSKNKQELIKKSSFMAAPYRQDSVYLNKIYFSPEGLKTDKTLVNGYNQGIVDSKTKKVTTTNKMTAPQRLFAEINMNLQKNYYVFVPADSTTEWTLRLEHIIPYSRFVASDINDTVYRLFNKYYQTERTLAPKNDKGEVITKDDISTYKSSMFNIVFNPDYKSETLNKEAFVKYIDDNVKSLINYLVQNKIITSVGTTDKYVISNLNTEFATANGLLKENSTNSKELTAKELFDLFKFTEVNYMINNIEMHKMFFGDPATIKDPLKRYKSFFSPREMAMYDSPEFNRTLNTELNKAGAITLTDKDYGYWNFKEYIPTATVEDLSTGELSILEDMTVEMYHDSYSETNPADGQSWGFLPGFREIMIKNGRWSDAQEELFQYLMAQDRLLMYHDGILNDNATSKYYYKPALKKHDEKLTEKPYTGSAKLSVIKPIGSGFTMENNIFLDKTSLAPLSYSLVRGTSLESVYLKMYRQGVSYIIMESGRKLGTGTKNKLYNKNGTINEDNFKDLINVPHRYYGVQVETEGSHGEGPLGSQLSKLATLNLRDGGVAFKAIVQGMIERHNTALKNLTNHGYTQVLKKLGIKEITTPEGTYFTAPDKKTVVNLLKQELFRREAPDNLKNMLSLNKDGNFTIPFEATANYQQIKDILYSYVDKLIAKPRLNGGPKIQLSGSGFEKEMRVVKTRKGKEILVSTGLKFYKAEYNEQGERTSVSRMQVMLPMWFRDQLKAHARWENATDAEILKYLNSTKAGQKVLQGIGFRIPTQELNSVEAFEVVDFLPEWVGDTIVLPEAITTKSGGDFDVDKLNTYLKNVYLDDNGDIRVVPYFGYGAEALKKFEELEVAAGYDNIVSLAEDMLNTSDIDQEERKLKRLAERLYEESLQNEYFDSLSDLILLPDNFDRLIRPNSAERGKALRKELETLAPNEFEGSKDKTFLNRQYMSNMRHLFLIGKAWVGISASSQTNNALNQSSQVILNPARIAALDDYEKVFLQDGNILLPHNKILYQGRFVPTLSRKQNSVGEYISDEISMLIDGPVDIAKDPWITQLFQNTNAFSTALLMLKLGIPFKTTVLFLNQPIIREYVKYLDLNNNKSLYNKDNIEKALKKFNTKLYKISTNKAGATVIENPLVVGDLSNKTLTDNIEKYYSGKQFTQLENEHQRTIFYEFLKYSKMGSQLFSMQQALSWDTNPQPDLFQQFKKEALVAQVYNYGIFESIRDVFENTQIGDIRKNVKNASKAIFQSFSVYNDQIKQVLFDTIDSLPSKHINAKKRQKIIRSIEDSFLTFMIQTNLGINNEIQDLMVNLETAVATKVYDIKNDLVRNHPDADITKNVILKQLISIVKKNKKQVKNVKIAQKAVEVFTSNMYTNAFREMRDNEHTKDLYYNLIKLSLLQSGTSQSPISYSKLIPYEDYSAIIGDLINNLKTAPNIQEFYNTGSFFRNSALNDDIVPLTPEQIYEGIKINETTYRWFNALKEANDIKQSSYRLFKFDVNSTTAKNRYVLYEMSSTDQEGDDRSIKFLLKRVEDETGEPLFIPNKVIFGVSASKGHYVYAPINAWGDAMFLQEHYNDPRPSAVPNTIYRVKKELPMIDIINAYRNKQDLEISEKTPIFADVKDHKMSYNMPANENLTGTDTTTLALVESGKRTATTRSFPLGKVGDIITFEGRNTKYKITNVEQLTEEKVNNPEWVKQWSEKEQWTTDHFYDVLGGKTVHIGSWQTSFEIVPDVVQGSLFDDSNIQPEGLPSIDISNENNCK